MIEKVFHIFKIVKKYFTDTRIRLNKLDTALVIREDGVQELFTPKLPDDDIVPENMLILTSIAYNLRDEKWINDTVFKFTEEVDKLKDGGESGSTDAANSLPDSWAGHDTSTKSSPDFLNFIEKKTNREKAAEALAAGKAVVANTAPSTSVSNLHFTVTDEEKAWIDAANKETLRQLNENEKEVDKVK